MTTMEQRPKRRGFEGQDHGTRGTDRRKVAFKKALRDIKPDLSIEDPEQRLDMYNFMREMTRFDANVELHRQSTNKADKSHLQEIIREGLASYDETDADQRHEARVESSQAHSDAYVEEFIGNTVDDATIEAEEAEVEKQLGDLYTRAQEIIEELNDLPRHADKFGMHRSQRKLDSMIDDLEGELESIKEQIDGLEGHASAPTEVEVGAWTEELKHAYEQQKHDVGVVDSEDDLGLDTLEPVRTRNTPR